jgi:hypothetical protein
MENIYGNGDSNLRQGDIIILEKKEYEENKLISKDIINLLDIVGLSILSNSCDLEHFNISHISIAPILTLRNLVQRIKEEKYKVGKSQDQIKDSMKKQIPEIVGYSSKRFFYLPENKERGINEDSVIMLEMIVSIKMSNEILELFRKRKVCSILNPWREKLGWRIGYLYNRIAHPEHCTKEECKEKIKNVCEGNFFE